MRLSFKKEPRETGVRSIARPNPWTQIKGDGKRVGSIRPPRLFGGGDYWEITIFLKKDPTPDDPAPFTNASVGSAFRKEADARAWLRENWKGIAAQGLFAPYDRDLKKGPGK